MSESTEKKGYRNSVGDVIYVSWCGDEDQCVSVRDAEWTQGIPDVQVYLWVLFFHLFFSRADEHLSVTRQEDVFDLPGVGCQAIFIAILDSDVSCQTGGVAALGWL